MTFQLPCQILRQIISKETSQNPERLVKTLCQINQLNSKQPVTKRHEKADSHLERVISQFPAKKFRTTSSSNYYNTKLHGFKEVRYRDKIKKYFMSQEEFKWREALRCAENCQRLRDTAKEVNLFKRFVNVTLDPVKDQKVTAKKSRTDNYFKIRLKKISKIKLNDSVSTKNNAIVIKDLRINTPKNYKETQFLQAKFNVSKQSCPTTHQRQGNALKILPKGVTMQRILEGCSNMSNHPPKIVLLKKPNITNAPKIYQQSIKHMSGINTALKIKRKSILKSTYLTKRIQPKEKPKCLFQNGVGNREVSNIEASGLTLPISRKKLPQIPNGICGAPKHKGMFAPKLKRLKKINFAENPKKISFENVKNKIEKCIRADDSLTHEPKKLPKLTLRKYLPKESYSGVKNWDFPRLRKLFDDSKMKFPHKKIIEEKPAFVSRLDIVSGFLQTAKPKKLPPIFPDINIRNIHLSIDKIFTPEKLNLLKVKTPRMDDVFEWLPKKKPLPPLFHTTQYRHFTTCRKIFGIISQHSAATINKNRKKIKSDIQNAMKIVPQSRTCSFNDTYPKFLIHKRPKYTVGCTKLTKSVNWYKMLAHTSNWSKNSYPYGIREFIKIAWQYFQIYRRRIAHVHLLNFEKLTHGFLNYHRDFVRSLKMGNVGKLTRTRDLPILPAASHCNICNIYFPNSNVTCPKCSKFVYIFSKSNACLKSQCTCKGIVDENIVMKSKQQNCCYPEASSDGQAYAIFMRQFSQNLGNNFTTMSRELNLREYFSKLFKFPGIFYQKPSPNWGSINSKILTDTEIKTNLRTVDANQKYITNLLSSSIRNLYLCATRPNDFKDKKNMLSPLHHSRTIAKSDEASTRYKKNLRNVSLVPIPQIPKMQRRSYCKKVCCCKSKPKRCKKFVFKKEKCRTNISSVCRKPRLVCRKKKPLSLLQRILAFFRARPNCPTPEEIRQKELTEKAEAAAKAAGYNLCVKKPKCECGLIKKNPCGLLPKSAYQSDFNLCKKRQKSSCGMIKKDQSQCKFSSLMTARQYGSYQNEPNVLTTMKETEDINDAALAKPSTTILPICQTNYIGKMYQVKLSKIGVKNKLTTKQMDEEPYTYCQICRFVPKSGIRHVKTIRTQVVSKSLKSQK